MRGFSSTHYHLSILMQLNLLSASERHSAVSPPLIVTESPVFTFAKRA
jgi:hypothetical protein